MYTFGKPTTCGEVPDETFSAAPSKRFRFAAFDSVGRLAVSNGHFSPAFCLMVELTMLVPPNCTNPHVGSLTAMTLLPVVPVKTIEYSSLTTSTVTQ